MPSEQRSAVDADVDASRLTPVLGSPSRPSEEGSARRRARFPNARWSPTYPCAVLCAAPRETLRVENKKGDGGGCSRGRARPRGARTTCTVSVSPRRPVATGWKGCVAERRRRGSMTQRRPLAKEHGGHVSRGGDLPARSPEPPGPGSSAFREVTESHPCPPGAPRPLRDRETIAERVCRPG